MARIHELLEEYGESHRHPVNKRLHWVCVPLIVWSLVALLSVLPFFEGIPTDWSILIMALAMIYYLRVSPRLALGILPVFIVFTLLTRLLADLTGTVWQVAVTVFVLAWIGQFIGHAIEGRRPSFFKDLQFLLIGPLWLLAFVFRGLGIRY